MKLKCWLPLTVALLASFYSVLCYIRLFIHETMNVAIDGKKIGDFVLFDDEVLVESFNLLA